MSVRIPLASLGSAFSAGLQIPASGAELEKPGLASLQRKLPVTDTCLVGTGKVVRVSAYWLVSSRELSLCL